MQKGVQHETALHTLKICFFIDLHQNRNLSKKKTPKTVVVSGFFDNCRKAVIISLRTEEHDERP